MIDDLPFDSSELLFDVAAANKFFVFVDAKRLAPSSGGSFGFCSSFESDLIAGIASVSSSSKSAFRTLLLLNGFDDFVSLVCSTLVSSLFVVLEIFSESSSLFASGAGVVVGWASADSHCTESDDVATCLYVVGVRMHFIRSREMDKFQFKFLNNLRLNWMRHHHHIHFVRCYL